MTAPLIYLHGLNSCGASHKAGVLRSALAPRRVLTPTYPAHRPDAAVDQLSRLIDRLCDTSFAAPCHPVIVGSSMGGFYGQYLSRRFAVAHLFMINPALRPWELLPSFVGQQMTTANGETYIVTPALLDETRAYGIEEPCNRIAPGADVPTTVFLDEGDEVIDYRVAEAMYRPCGRVHVYPDGDHAFQHLDEALCIIQAELQQSAG